MGRVNSALYAFNRGLISDLALARTDLKRTQFSASTMNNWMPRVMGSMMLRPGTEYLGTTYNNVAANFLPFIFSMTDTALLEISESSLLRVWVNDALVTVPSVSTAITNGTFAGNITGWTDADESGATSDYTTITTGPHTFEGMRLIGTGVNSAIRSQQVTVAAADQSIEHFIYIVVNGADTEKYPPGFRSPITLKVGSTSGGSEYFNYTLETGYHALSFTPSANFYVQIENKNDIYAYVEECIIMSAGTLTVPTPWGTSVSSLRYDQSGDVVFNANDGFRQYKIERRSTHSWSVVPYMTDDGPFRNTNTSTITMTPSALSGDAVTLTASKDYFSNSHYGALFRVASNGQTVNSSITAENTFTTTIEVTGVSTQRTITITRSGTWVATVTLQRSLTSETGPWEDVTTYTTNDTVGYTDGLDNQIAWYRIGVKTGDFTSGTAVLTLDFPYGSITGIIRLYSITSTTVATGSVLTAFGSTDASDNWAEGMWSVYRGYPTAGAFAEGRLWWAGRNGIQGSISDAYYSFDDTVIGDSGTILRTIGSGPVDTINWILALQRILFGAQGAEFVCKSSLLDEPLTPTAFTIKEVSTQGSAAVETVKLDKAGIYIQRGGGRVMQIATGVDQNGYVTEYGSQDLTLLTPEIGSSPILRMAVQRQPDTRIHCVRTDGTVAIFIHDSVEGVNCWCYFSTDGYVEDVVVLPGANGTQEDSVYYVVKRTINGSTVRYLEKWALESECQGSTDNKQADSFYYYSGASTTLIPVSHLEGETVVVWGNGKNLGTYTVSSGQITLSEAVTSCTVGLSYTAQWQSSKLAYAAQWTALNQKKRLHHLGVILKNTHYQGLQFGPDFAFLDDLPSVMQGAIVAADTVFSSYDDEMFEFPGEWDTDSRLCLQAQAPNPCTILAAVMGIETHEKS